MARKFARRVVYFLGSAEFPGRCFGTNSIFWAAVSGTKAIHPGTRCRDVGVYPMGSSDNSIVGFRELIRLREVVNSLVSTLLALFLIDQRAAIVELDFLSVPVLFRFALRSRFACLRRARVCVLASHD